MPLYTGIGGVVKEMKELSLGVGGAVKKAKNGYMGVGGVVKQFYSAELLDQLTGFELRLESWTAYWCRNTYYEKSTTQPTTIQTEYDISGEGGDVVEPCISGDSKTHTLKVFGYHLDARGDSYSSGYTIVYYDLYSKNLPVEKSFKELMEELNNVGKLNSFSFTVPSATGYHHSSYPSIGGNVNYYIAFGKNLSLNGNYPLRNLNAVISKNDMFGENGYWNMWTKASTEQGGNGTASNIVFSRCELQFPQSVNINGKSYPITFKSLIKGVSI